MTTIQRPMATFRTQNVSRPSQAMGPSIASPTNAAGTSSDGDDEIEVRHPGPEDRSRLAVEIDRQGEDHALRDQESDLAREGHPREIVEQQGQLRVPLRAEGGEEPEQIGHEEDRGAAGRARDDGVREDRRAMRHPPNLQHDQRQDRDQPHREPVEDDHAVANAREVLRIAIEGRDLLRRHRRRHRLDEARKQQEGGEPDDVPPRATSTAGSARHRLVSSLRLLSARFPAGVAPRLAP